MDLLRKEYFEWLHVSAVPLEFFVVVFIALTTSEKCSQTRFTQKLRPLQSGRALYFFTGINILLQSTFCGESYGYHFAMKRPPRKEK